MHPDARLLPLCRRPHRPPMHHKNFNIIAELATNSIAFIHAWRHRYRITNPCTPTPSFGYGSSPSVSTEYILSSSIQSHKILVLLHHHLAMDRVPSVSTEYITQFLCLFMHSVVDTESQILVLLRHHLAMDRVPQCQLNTFCRRYRVTKSSYSHTIIWLRIESLSVDCSRNVNSYHVDHEILYAIVLDLRGTPGDVTLHSAFCTAFAAFLRMVEFTWSLSDNTSFGSIHRR